MNKVDIVKKFKDVVVKIIIYENNKYIGYGSGVIVNDSGRVLTAWHVVNKVKNIGVGINHKIEILVPNHGVCEYRLKTFELKNLETPMVIFDVDIAILEPINEITNVKHIDVKYDTTETEIGEDVLLFGYSDIDKFLSNHYRLNLNNELVRKSKSITEEFRDKYLHQIICKSGMIGQKWGTFLEDAHIPKKVSKSNGTIFDINELKNIKYQIYFIDTGMNEGASGGALINMNGELIGIITQKTLIPETKPIILNGFQYDNTLYYVPSDVTLAIEISAFEFYLNKL